MIDDVNDVLDRALASGVGNATAARILAEGNVRGRCDPCKPGADCSLRGTTAFNVRAQKSYFPRQSAQSGDPKTVDKQTIRLGVTNLTLSLALFEEARLAFPDASLPQLNVSVVEREFKQALFDIFGFPRVRVQVADVVFFGSSFNASNTSSVSSSASSNSSDAKPKGVSSTTPSIFPRGTGSWALFAGSIPNSTANTSGGGSTWNKTTVETQLWFYLLPEWQSMLAGARSNSSNSTNTTRGGNFTRVAGFRPDASPSAMLDLMNSRAGVAALSSYPSVRLSPRAEIVRFDIDNPFAAREFVRCLGQACLENGVCQEGYTGPLCSVCDIGFGR